MGSTVEQTGSASSDTSVANGLRIVYWLFVEAGGTGGAWSLEDGTDASGTVKLAGSMAANERQYFDWQYRPLELKTGIFFDIAGTNVTMTVGYS